MATIDEHGEERPAFGMWLLAQRDRGDWIDGIAAAARTDRHFPSKGRWKWSGSA